MQRLADLLGTDQHMKKRIMEGSRHINYSGILKTNSFVMSRVAWLDWYVPLISCNLLNEGSSCTININVRISNREIISFFSGFLVLGYLSPLILNHHSLSFVFLLFFLLLVAEYTIVMVMFLHELKKTKIDLAQILKGEIKLP